MQTTLIALGTVLGLGVLASAAGFLMFRSALRWAESLPCNGCYDGYKMDEMGVEECDCLKATVAKGMKQG